MPKIAKVITYEFREVAQNKSGIPIGKGETVIIKFPVGDLIVANGKITFNTKR